MSGSDRVAEEDGGALGRRGPVTGTVPRRHDRPGAGRGDRMGRSGAQSPQREEVLRVLMEAYRRDAGPGSFEAG